MKLTKSGSAGRLKKSVNSAFYEWRDAVASPQGPSKPVTRHLLLTLALFMDADGGGAYPSYELLAERTGLSKRSVTTHMRLAAEQGWLTRKVRGRNGQGWRLYQYSISIPASVVDRLGEPDRPTSNYPQGGAGGSTPLSRRGADGAKRVENERVNVRQEVHTISPLDLSNDLSSISTKKNPSLGKSDSEITKARENVKALIDQVKARTSASTGSARKSAI